MVRIMKLVRFIGILLTFIAVLTASAETVIAFSGNAAEYESLFTSDVCAIILGNDIDTGNELLKILLNAPAWVFFGMMGIAMIFVSGLKKNRSEMIYNRFYRNF